VEQYNAIELWLIDLEAGLAKDEVARIGRVFGYKELLPQVFELFVVYLFLAL